MLIMKTKIMIPALVMSLLSLSCIKSGKTEESGDAVADTVAKSMDANEHVANENSSELMASMNRMMKQMHEMEMSGNTDHDLAGLMEEHHKSAVEMADILIESGTDAEMKSLAQKIKAEQEGEIVELQKLQGKYKDAAKNYDPKNSKEGLGKAMGEDMMAMMQMPDPTGESLDREFATLMVKHHEDGVKMGKTILQHAKDAQFKVMAQKMIISQEKDIAVMKNWLNK